MLVICVFLVPVPMQSIAWKDQSLKWPIRLCVELYSIAHSVTLEYNYYVKSRKLTNVRPARKVEVAETRSSSRIGFTRSGRSGFLVALEDLQYENLDTRTAHPALLSRNQRRSQCKDNIRFCKMFCSFCRDIYATEITALLVTTTRCACVRACVSK